MVTLKRAQFTLMMLVIIMFIASVLITIYAGVNPKVALVDNALDSLQIDYNLIPFGAASNPLVLISKLLDAGVFPILTVILAAWFFDFINNFNIRERIMLSKLRKLKDHVIIVPYNNFAKSLIQEFKSSGIKVVAIAENAKELAQLRREGEIAIDGDIRSLETYEIAEISKARCLIACSKDDIQNALVAITAKTANPHIKIIARANKEENIGRLGRAGAHKVIIPERTAGIDIGEEISKRILTKKKES